MTYRDLGDAVYKEGFFWSPLGYSNSQNGSYGQKSDYQSKDIGRS